MKVFFDNCTSPVLASTLNGFIQYEGHAAYHIKDVPGLPKGRHSTDTEWIDHLRRSQDLWIVITADHRLRKNPGERAAFRQAGLHGFLLAKSAQKMPLHLVASTLLAHWPDIAKLVNMTAPPAMWEVPMGRSSKFSQLPF